MARSWFWRVTFFVLVAVGVRVLNGLVPTSPCPEQFYYYEESRTSQILGTLQIPPPLDSVNITIKANFIVPVYFNTKYAGRIDLIEDINALGIRLTKQSNNPQDIRYSVHFPIQRPLPLLKNLTVNGRVICSQNLDNIGLSYTWLSLRHDLSLPTPAFTTETKPQFLLPNSIWKYTVPPRPFYYPTTRTPNTSPVVEIDERFQQNSADCGLAVQVGLLVVSGSSVNRGAWPWLTAIFWTTQIGLEFKCGGTLISKNHVITAAHCVTQQPSNKVLTPKELLIYLGKDDLFNWNEQDAQPKYISRIVVHPQYDSLKKGNDVAVLFLETPATLNLYVRPACLWNPLNSYSNNGSVVGWGKDENNLISKSPKLAVLPIVSQEECLTSKNEFLYFTSNTTLCAGARDGVGPCKGDSGGGMYLKARDTDGIAKWFVRGIVSLSLQSPDSITECDLKNYVVFTDLSKLGDWIREAIGRGYNQ